MESYILAALITVVILSEIGFIFSLATKDASIADVFWGLYFIGIAGIFLFKDSPSVTQNVITALVTVWGLRLFLHISARKIGKPEDFRYAKSRDSWGEAFAIRSYLSHFLFQALLAVIISASIIVAAHADANYNSLHWWQYLGILVWLKGFFFESVSDFQLSSFIKKRHDKLEIMKSGLWKFSRHPNYYGEILQWWGIWLIAIGLPYGFWAIISPLTISLLIFFVSGVPILEKKYKSNENYQKYAQKTSILIPWFPKK